MKFIKVQTDRETQQIQKVEPDKQTWRRPLWTTMMISLRCLKTVYFDILVMLGKHILILFDTNETVILSSINHCLQSLKRNLKQRLCQLFYLFIYFFLGGGGGGGDGGQGVLWEMCKLQMLMFTFVIFFDPARYTYGKGAKGRANIQLYFDYYSRGKRPALAKDIAVSTDYFFTILTKTVYFYWLLTSF